MSLNLRNGPLAFKIDQKRIFDKLHEVPEIDYVLDILKSYFAKKYNVDYLSVNMFNKQHNCVIGRYDYDIWHDYLVKHNGTVYSAVFDVKQLHGMEKNSVIFDYFDYLMLDRNISIRAELFGERKYAGCTIKFSNEVNDKTVYDVTFKDDLNIANLSEDIANAFMRELRKCQNVLKLFVDYGDIYGNFNDKIAVGKLMDQWRKEFAFLL